MDITKKIARVRFIYHSNMLDVNNVAYQLGLRKEIKAEERGKFHAMQCMDCLDRLGYNLDKIRSEGETK